MPGRVEAIHIAAAEGAPMEARESVEIRADLGIVGDRYAAAGRKGQLTLVAVEELAEAGRELGIDIPRGATRRNVTVRGVPLSREPGARLRLGPVVVEVTGPAEPCDIMEASVAPGARDALKARAGIRARVIEGGVLRVGAPADVVNAEVAS